MGKLRTLSALVAALALLPAALLAQGGGTVSGRVTAQESGTPLGGAQVRVEGTVLRAITGQNGQYTINGVPAGSQVVTVSLIGRQAGRRTVAVAAGQTVSANFSLVPSAVQLEGLVVTATGEQQRSREIGNDVPKINVARDVPLAATPTVSSVLQGRVAGVTVLQSGGTTGTGSRIRIRGSNSIALGNEPLIVVDGIRVSNSKGNSIGVGGQSVSRLDDFNPEDIESMEVLKGPSASALYGTAAANGVVVITTKKGRSGRTRWNAYAEMGNLKKTNQFPANYSGFCSYYDAETNKRIGDIPGCDTAFFYDLQNAYDGVLRFQRDSLQVYNPLETTDSLGNNPFQTGNRSKYGLSASGGTDLVTYYLSGEFERENGVYTKVSNLRNVNLRANLRGQLTDKIDVTVQSGYISSDLRLPQNDNNILGILPSALLGGATPESGFGFFTLPNLQFINTKQNVARFVGSAQANYRPLSWLSFNALAGLDQINRFDNEVIPANRIRYASLPEGERTGNRLVLSTYTANLNTTANYGVTPAITGSSSAGFQYTQELFRGTYAYGRGLLAGCSSLACVATGFEVGETNTDARTAGGYLRQQFGANDRLFLTGAVRFDKNNAFGANLGTVAYPSASVSWVVADEPWFPQFNALSTLRLRSAYGESGLQPGVLDPIAFLSPTAVTIGSRSQPAFVFGGFGNPNLKPERSREIEAGFDLGLFNDRVGGEFTWYRKRSTDALVNVPLPPSLGRAATRTLNLGSVENRGIETSLRTKLFDRDAFRWDLTGTFTTTRNKLVSLGIDPLTGDTIQPIIFGLGGNTQRHTVGRPLGAYFAAPYTYSDANGDGIIQTNEVQVADSAEFAGSPFPGREASLQSNFSLGRWLRLSGLLDYKGNYRLFNATEEFRCDAFFNCQAAYAGYGNNMPSLEDQARYVAAAYGGEQGTPTVYGYIEDASFVKLREVSATFTLPTRFARPVGAQGLSLTLAGRNLKTWTDYTGTDPEINFAGSGANFITAEFLSQPPVRYLTARIDVNF